MDVRPELGSHLEDEFDGVLHDWPHQEQSLRQHRVRRGRDFPRQLQTCRPTRLLRRVADALPAKLKFEQLQQLHAKK